jgi:polyferredoxin
MKKIFNFWKKYSYLILPVFVIAGLFNSRVGMIAVICMAAPIVLSIFRGRFWCGNLCPRGCFYDKIVSRLRFKSSKLHTMC